MEQTQALEKEISFGMLIKFSLPTIASMIFMNIYSTVDGVFVSRLIGTNALSAVNIVFPLIMFSMAIGTMFGSGGNALVAKMIGEGKEKQARQVFTLLIVIAFAVCAALSVLSFIFLDPLLGLLGANEVLYAYSTSYMIPLLVFMPFSIFGMIFQMSFITVGKAHLGLIVSVLGGVTNVVLDYLFIAVMKMGIEGAAIATGIGYSLPALIGLFYFSFNRKGNLYVVKPVVDMKAVWKSCSNGASEMVASLSSGVVTVLLNNIIIRLAGADGVASITIIFYVQGILSAAYLGYAYGVSPIISYNYGKGAVDRLQKIYRISLRSILVVSVVTFAASLTFARPLVNIFTKRGTDVYDMAVYGYRLFSIGFLFFGFNGFSSAMFTALNNGKVSAILSFFRTLVFIMITVLTLPALMGMTGVWLAIPVAEIFSICMTAYYFRKMRSVYQYA